MIILIATIVCSAAAITFSAMSIYWTWKSSTHTRAADWYRSWRARPIDTPRPKYVVRSERWRDG